MKIKIYGGCKSWTRDSRARWLLDEAGKDYEVVSVDVFAGDQRKPEFLAKNPLGKIPVLEEGDVQIFESGAILADLADRYAPELVPAIGTTERAEYYQWLFYSAATLEAPIVKVFVNRFLFPTAEGAQDRAQQAVNEFALHARLLSEKLSEREYLVGNRFTAADIMIGTALVWADKGEALGDYPVLEKYLARLYKRPAFKKALTPVAKEFAGYPGKAAAN